MTSNEILTASEVAKPYFRTSKAQVYEWMRTGIFPKNVAFRINRKVLFNKTNLENWLANGGTCADSLTLNNKN